MHESCNKLALLQDSVVVFPTFHTLGWKDGVGVNKFIMK
jgi:hypothetical protein